MGSRPGTGARNPGGGVVGSMGGNGPVGGQQVNGGVPGGGEPNYGGSEPGYGGTPPLGSGGSGEGGGYVPPSNGGLANVGGDCNVQLVDPNTLPPCTSCMGGRCVQPADYPDAPVSQLAPCDGGGICLPDLLVSTKGKVALPRCQSVAGGEGRCASLCIPVTASLAGFLPQGGCAPTDRCAPCFSPVDGTSTGICNIGCDTGPTTPPVVFPQCCSGRARCVPRAVIPDGPAKKNLAKEKCTGNNDPVCVPTPIIQNPAYRFPACVSQNFLDPGSPGVCIPACIVDANPAGKALGRDNCAELTDKCVPCTNPANGQPSGACL
jgi:hypothetical protein